MNPRSHSRQSFQPRRIRIGELQGSVEAVGVANEKRPMIHAIVLLASTVSSLSSVRVADWRGSGKVAPLPILGAVAPIERNSHSLGFYVRGPPHPFRQRQGRAECVDEEDRSALNREDRRLQTREVPATDCRQRSIPAVAAHGSVGLRIVVDHVSTPIELEATALFKRVLQHATPPLDPGFRR